jgi:hypothetical protein
MPRPFASKKNPAVFAQLKQGQNGKPCPGKNKIIQLLVELCTGRISRKTTNLVA